MGRPISQRPADLCYVVFFGLHLLASLMIDGQAFYPKSMVPKVLQNVLADYIKDSADPLISNVWHPRYAWFSTLLTAEMLIQVPAFAFGILHLLRGASAQTQHKMTSS